MTISLPPQQLRAARHKGAAASSHCEPEIERLVLGSMLCAPKLLDENAVGTTDFTLAAHRTIMHTLQTMRADGVAIDSVSLVGRLRDDGNLETVGGASAIDDLTDKTRVIPPFVRLRVLTARRRLDMAAQRLAEASRLGEPLQDVFEALDAARVASDELQRPAAKVPAFALLSESIVDALKPVGERFKTGFATLDDATRGGIPRGRLVFIVGAPGAGKSTLAVQFADQWERQGCAVAYLAADEPAEGIITRVGQLDGYSREALESDGDGSDAVRAQFAKHSAARSMAVIDPERFCDAGTIEGAATVLEHMAAGRPSVLIVDSLQTVRCIAAERAESTRERIDAKVGVLKSIASRGVLVIAISEMSRAGYRSGDRNTDVSALAASKESGSVEYGASLLIGLRSVKGEGGAVDVEVAKNRIGGAKPEFRLQLDFERARFSEAAMPEPQDRRLATEEAKAAAARSRVLAAVRKAPGKLTSANAISRAAGGNKSDNLAMVRELVEERALVTLDGGYRLGGG